MSIYFPASLKYFDPKWVVYSTWIDHIPFGYDIVEAVKPELLVELGTYRGLSYFSFCQSVKDHGLDTLCYAVDTWEGDEHIKLKKMYDESAYQNVLMHNNDNYHGFSYLLKMLFNEALDSFNDESIDLLHIDGYHTYNAVSEDFKNWYPKVKPGGIILFHDIAARIKSDFGVWKFWEEYSSKYESFTFNHGFGLGVIRKSGGPPTDSLLVNLLFSNNATDKKTLRKIYVHASKYFKVCRKVKTASHTAPSTKQEKKPQEPISISITKEQNRLIDYINKKDLKIVKRILSSNKLTKMKNMIKKHTPFKNG
jgi:hypothetical protein